MCVKVLGVAVCKQTIIMVAGAHLGRCVCRW